MKILLTLAAIVALGCGSSSTAQKPAAATAPAAAEAEAAAPALTAESVLDRAIEATGGAEAHLAIKTSIMKGTMSLPSQNINGTLTIYTGGAGLAYTVLDLPGLGNQESGVNGDVAWEKSSMTGSRILDGEERAVALRDADPRSEIDWRTTYKKAELAGTADVGGVEAIKVEVTTPEDRVQTRFYDPATGFEIRREAVMMSQMGEMPTGTRFEKFKPAGGIVGPHRIVLEVMGMEQVIEISPVEVNVDIPAERFTLPDDIKALVAQ